MCSKTMEGNGLWKAWESCRSLTASSRKPCGIVDTSPVRSSLVFSPSARINLASVATFQRKALQPITLSDGTHIPPGTMTFSPANAVNFDPDIYPDPEKFDGLRFYKLRQASERDANRYQLTSITKTQLQFGSGRHACPGRWFAAHQNKLVVAAVVQQYDIKLKDGEGRPKGILFQTNQFPDPKAEVLFRTRNVEV